MRVLGIETSCDETAVAIVEDGRQILSHQLLSQWQEHVRFGGVVPEIAARAHMEHLDRLIKAALGEAGLSGAQLDGIAATCGPGLIGGVMVGAMTGKALALGLKKPFLAINHLEAHALTARLTDGVAFPYLLLLISGGHCQLLAVEGVGHYRLYGSTLDDAVGEAFDKVAKLLELGYPGGPAVEAAAQHGNPLRFALPQPLAGRQHADFSFSGLKTAVRHCVEAQRNKGSGLTAPDKADIAASFQHAVAGCLADRTAYAMQLFSRDFPPPYPHGYQQVYPPGYPQDNQASHQTYPQPYTLVVAGGVAANRALRAALEKTAAAHGFTLVAPPPALCTDNGVMVAWAGLEKLRLGAVDGLDFAPRPRWPLTELGSAA